LKCGHRPEEKIVGRSRHVAYRARINAAEAVDVEVLRPRVARDRPHLERMKELLAAGAVWPPAIARYPLAEAHRISEGRHLQGKLVLIVR
jgi:NADPH:quinone reductase-like Zn-dependent oxidoreductase